MTDIAPGTIGQSLRNRRLQNNKTIEEVADATRVQAKYLKALEEERWSDLPARVFLEGFLTKYAEHLGLDAAETVRQLRQQLGQSEKPPFTHPEPVPETTESGSWLQVRLPFVMLSLVFLVLAGFYFYRAQQERARPASMDLNRLNASPDPLPVDLAASTAAVAATATAGHTATVKAQNLVWLRVWSDGAVRFEGTLNAGETRRWPFQSTLRVRAGNISRVAVDIDGSPAPSATSSNPGEILWPGSNGERATLTLSAPATRPPARAAVSTGAPTFPRE